MGVQKYIDSEQLAESWETRHHIILSIGPAGGQMASGCKVEKTLNVQDSLISKASMISEERRNEDD